MSRSRLRRLAAARRPHATVLLGVLLVAIFGSPAIAADPVSGLVVDQSGQPLPRAYVRSLDQSGATTAGTFADEAGRFRIMPASDGCRLEISLTGFQASTVSCATSGSTRVTLAVAPIHETVIVTATRTDAPASQVGASATTFEGDEIVRHDRPLVSELLRASPGAMLVRSGSPGAQTSLFVRGGESNYNKVLLDGIPLNEPGGTFNFGNLTTENLERVEFVRGAHSALFGSDAVASVVQLFTRRADRSSNRPRATVQIDGGTYDTVHVNAAVSGAARAVDYSLGVARLTTDNRVPNSRFENTTLTVNAGVALSESTTVRVIGRGELQTTGTPGQTMFGRPDLDARFRRHDGVGGIILDQQVTPAFRQRASYSFAASNQASTNLTSDLPYTPTFGSSAAPFQFFDFAFDSHSSLHRHRASYQADWRLASHASYGDHLLTLLMDWDGERMVLDDRVAAAQTAASRDNFGWSAQHQVLWPRVFVTLSGRIERNDSFGTAAVPRGTLVVVAHESAGAIGETRLKASAGLGIKEPTVLQSFSPSPYFLGNPNLEPERSRTMEAGIEQRLGRDRAKIEVTVFDNRYRNIISLETTNPLLFESQYSNNVRLMRARGAELGAEIAPLDALRVRAGYTFLDSKILESTSTSLVYQQGRWAFRRPRHSGFLQGTWTWQSLTADLSGVFIGRFVDDDFSMLQPPIVDQVDFTRSGYTTWDARFSYKVSANLTGLLAIDNLTGTNYMEPLGYQALGRAARAGLRVAF